MKTFLIISLFPIVASAFVMPFGFMPIYENITLPCIGFETGGHCFYAGAEAESCDTVCSNTGRTCDFDGTIAVGSNSTISCATVAAAVGFTGPNGGDYVDTATDTGFGCFEYEANFIYRNTGYPTNCEASSLLIARVCACN